MICNVIYIIKYIDKWYKEVDVVNEVIEELKIVDSYRLEGILGAVFVDRY